MVSGEPSRIAEVDKGAGSRSRQHTSDRRRAFLRTEDVPRRPRREHEAASEQMSADQYLLALSVQQKCGLVQEPLASSSVSSTAILSIAMAPTLRIMERRRPSSTSRAEELVVTTDRVYRLPSELVSHLERGSRAPMNSSIVFQRQVPREWRVPLAGQSQKTYKLSAKIRPQKTGPRFYMIALNNLRLPPSDLKKS